MEKEKFSRYEISRILGARALQIAMNAPLLVKINTEELEKIHYDPLKIAEIEFGSGILPISVNRPSAYEERGKVEESKRKITAKKIGKAKEEKKEIEKEGEIMELATPDDEVEEELKKALARRIIL